MSETSWDDLYRLERAKVVAWETLKAREFAKFWWHMNLGYWFWSRALLDRLYTILEWLLVLLPFAGVAVLVMTASLPEIPEVSAHPRFSLYTLIEQPVLLLYLSVPIAWLVIANIVVCCSDRTYRQSGNFSAVLLRLLCRWMWLSFSGSSPSI
jgi:hypothetical protein